MSGGQRGVTVRNIVVYFYFSNMKNQRTTFSLLLTVLALVDIFCIITFLGLVSGSIYTTPKTAGFNFS